LIEEKGQKYSLKKIKEIITNIRETGINNNILSSDLGQEGNLDPVSGFEFYLDKLKYLGLTDKELTIMAKVNPAKLLGLKKY